MAKPNERERKKIAKNLAYSSGMRGGEEPPEDDDATTAVQPPQAEAQRKPEEADEAPRRRRGQPKDRGVFASGLRGAEKAPPEK